MINEENLNKLYEGIINGNELTIKELNDYGFNSKDIAEYDKATECFNKCYELDPTHSGTCFQLFLRSITKKDYESAFKYFEVLSDTENPYYSADSNFYLYLLSIITDIPDKHKEYARYLKFYHELGFHILLPNNRAHGNSEGEYIGFGWLDRIDCLQWIDTMKLYFHDQDIQIVLHGISMGSATVLMASGEELPSEVKCIISDCGFTSVYEEMKHEMKRSHIPTVILPTATLLSKKRVGYNFKEASTINQVKKSHTPTLFIHGDQDDFVPTYMVYDLYNACQAPKDLLIVEGAKHAESYIVNQELCEKTIVDFMSNYVKL